MIQKYSRYRIIKKIKNPDACDIASVAVVLASLLFMLSIWNFLPIFVDWAYHTAIGVEILERGVITDNLYQFAPAGRPLIYPPLLSYFYALLFYFGIDGLAAAKVLSVIFYPAFLFSFWHFCRRKAGPMPALLFLIALASSYEIFSWFAQPTPITLAFIAAPFAFLLAEKIIREKHAKKDCIVLAALLSLLLYLHFAALYFIALPVALVAAIKKSRELMKIAAISMLIYSPWGIHTLLNWKYVNFVHFQEWFVLSPVLLFLSIAFVLSKDMKKLLKSQSVVMFSIMSAVILLLIPFHPTRMFGYAVIPLAFFASLSMDSVLKTGIPGNLRNKKIIGMTLITVFLLSSLAEFSLVYDANKIEFETRRNPLVKRVLAPSELMLQSRAEYTQLADWIKTNTKKDDIIVTYDLNEIPVVITTLTGRRTTWGMFSEIRPGYSLLAAKKFIEENGTIEVEKYNPAFNYTGKEIARFGGIIVLNITSGAAKAVENK